MQFGTERSISDSREVKAEYLSCLKHLSSLISDSQTERTHQFQGVNLQNLKDEIKNLEVEIGPRKQRN